MNLATQRVETKRAKPADCPNCASMRSQLDRSIRTREEVKAALECVDGPAAFFRRLCKAQREALSRNRKASPVEIAKLDGLFARADALTEATLAGKQALHSVWSTLDDENPLKQRLWEIWTGL